MPEMLPSPHVSACEQLAEMLSPQRSDLRIQSLTTLEQLQQLWKIDKQAYADCSLEFEEFLQWWTHYPLGSQCLMSDSEIVASIGIYPLMPEQWKAFCSGSLPEFELVPVSLDACEEMPQHYWYASGIVVIEELRGWGTSPLKTLLQYALSSWISSSHVAYPLHICAVAEYAIGAKILDYFGFVKQCDASEMPNGCDLYSISLDSQRQALHLLKFKGL